MGRHAGDDPAGPVRDRPPGRGSAPRAGARGPRAGRRAWTPARTAVLAVLSLLLAASLTGLAVLTDAPSKALRALEGTALPRDAAVPTTATPSPGEASRGAPGEPQAAPAGEPSHPALCRSTEEVDVVLGDSLEPALAGLEQRPLGPDADGVCARVVGVGLGPAQVLASLRTGLTGQRGADVWVPDSSLWARRAAEAGVALEHRGSLGTSPLVVATSPEVVEALGWRDDPPTWVDVFASERPLAVPDLHDSAGTLMAMDVARDQAGAAAARVTVQAVLARQRAGTLSPSQGVLQVATLGADAPLVLTTEQDVLHRTAGATTAVLEAVGVSGGTPVLDHPVLQVRREGRSPEHAAAVALVAAALASGPGQAVAFEAGLRGPDLQPLPGAVPLVPVEEPFVGVDDVDTDAVLGDLATLAAPSRLLVVVDVSRSMSAQVGDGATRADVAAEALQRALGDLPGTAEVGVWFFASGLGGDRDWTEVAPVAPVDAVREDGTTQRQALEAAVAAVPGSLVDGGTSLYDTTDAAVSAARAAWEESVVSTVVLVTDGRNEDSSGLTLEQLQERLADGAEPDRPVGLVAVAFGPDADLAALEQVTAAVAASGAPAQALDARDPDALRRLLVDVLAARTAR